MNKNSITILIIILSSFIASMVQSSWGDVDVQTIKFPTQNGQWVVADLYKPYSATSENPAPLIIVIPGFQRSKETLSNISIELSRRGIVVISIDPYAQGSSSSSMSRRAATKEGYGMFAIVDYIYETSNLNYIDKNRIGATGHSAGGLAAIRGAQYFGDLAKKTSSKSKLHSVFVSGMIRMGFKNKDIKKIKSNVGLSYALYDEGAWQNKLGHGDMRFSPESLGLINHQIKNGTPLDSIEIGQYYGQLSNRTLSIVHNEKVLHPFQPYSTKVLANQINFFLKTFNINDSISAKDQVWYWKEFMTLIAMICSFLLIIPIAKYLLSLPYFSTLVNPIPNPIPKPKKVGKYIFWSTIVVSSIIACFSFIPLSELSKVLFSQASERNQTWFFPQRMNNAVMLWAIFNGLFGLLLFFGSYQVFGKNNGIHPELWGLSIKKSALFKTLILGITIFGFYFILMNVIYYFFHVDYRFVFISVRTFRPITLLLLPMYLPFFFIFFLSNSIRVNSSLRIEGHGTVKSMLLYSFATASGLIIILFIQYMTFWITGNVFWEEGWLYVNLLFGIVPIMLVLPLFHRSFFNLTGSVYLGPITMSLIFITILLSNTVCYFLL